MPRQICTDPSCPCSKPHHDRERNVVNVFSTGMIVRWVEKAGVPDTYVQEVWYEDGVEPTRELRA